MKRMLRLLIGSLAAVFASAALAQAPVLGDQAKEILGSWEFSNAGRDKNCAATFKRDTTSVGFKVEFDANCASLFPLVKDVAGWVFPDNDLLRLVDAQGKTLMEFSEVEDGIYEAPTPGVGVLFLQNASAAPAARAPEQVAGDWAIARGTTIVCALTLSPNAAKDGFALTVKAGCDSSVARLAFAQWRMDRGELLLVPARGNPWRFEEGDNGNWRRIPESAEAFALVRQ